MFTILAGSYTICKKRAIVMQSRITPRWRGGCLYRCAAIATCEKVGRKRFIGHKYNSISYENINQGVS